MKFDQTHQIEGEFWLPQTDRRFYGRIDHTTDATRMHLVNSSVISGYGGRPISPTVTLFGETDVGYVSVLDLHPLSWATRGDHANTIDCLAGTVVVGDHVEGLRDLEVRSVAVDIHGLLEILAGAWPEPGLLSPRGGEHGNGEVFAVGLGKDVEVICQVGEHTSISRGSAKPFVYSDVRFVLPAGWSCGAVEERLIFPMRDFVQFCTRRASYVNSLTVHRSADLRNAFKVLAAPYPKPDDRSNARVDALSINLRDVGDPGAAVSRWFSLSYEVGPVWPIFFSALRGTGLLEDRFLSLVAFAEGFHRALHDKPQLSKRADRDEKKLVSEALKEHPDVRRVFKEALGHANSQPLRERLEFFSTQATDILGWDLDAEIFCSQVVHTRNWMVHWGDPGRHVVREADALVRLVRQLELVLSVAVMTDVGLGDAEIARAVASGWRFEGLP
jgi:Apea-like HEPN/ApeA N-terminal domain 1